MTTTSSHRIVLAGKYNIQGGAFASGGRKIKNNLIQAFNFGSVQIRYKEVTLFTLLSGDIFRSSNKHKQSHKNPAKNTRLGMHIKKWIRDLSNTILYIPWLSVPFLNFLFWPFTYTFKVPFSLKNPGTWESCISESTIFSLNLGRVFDHRVLVS